MERTVLCDEQWDNIQGLLSGKSTDCGVTVKNNRQFIEAVLWIARTGAPWRDLPEKLEYWHRVYVRYNRWSVKGAWNRIIETLSADPDLEYLMVDGSVVQVHQHGAPQKKNRTQKRWVSLA
ncbi:MAG TPA: transposase, partial [Gammaproteobacteria bacterium]|nr:transposase [Gammaproteobacteria bacterium]